MLFSKMMKDLDTAADDPARSAGPESHGRPIKVLALGPEIPWVWKIRRILEDGGFRVQAGCRGADLVEQFQKGGYSPQAVLFYLSPANWPGPEILPQIKTIWPQTKLLVYAENNTPRKISIGSLRDADLFYRGYEDWARLGEVIKKALQPRDAAAGKQRFRNFQKISRKPQENK